MSLGKSIIQGMMGAYLMSGIDIHKIDWCNHVLFISIPKESYEYQSSKVFHDAESYAKRIKETWIEMGIFPPDCSVKYKIKNIKWTKEMGNKNYEENKHKIFDLSLW